MMFSSFPLPPPEGCFCRVIETAMSGLMPKAVSFVACVVSGQVNLSPLVVNFPLQFRPSMCLKVVHPCSRMWLRFHQQLILAYLKQIFIIYACLTVCRYGTIPQLCSFNPQTLGEIRCAQEQTACSAGHRTEILSCNGISSRNIQRV